jgi:hypothetical protein
LMEQCWVFRDKGKQIHNLLPIMDTKGSTP